MGKPNKASNGHLRLGQPMPEDKEPRERTRGRRSGRVTCPPKNDQWRKRRDQPGSNTWTRPRYTRWAPVNKTILAFNHNCEHILSLAVANMTVWPSGLRRWLQAPVRKGVGSNPTAVIVLPFRFGSPVGKPAEALRTLSGSRARRFSRAWTRWRRRKNYTHSLSFNAFRYQWHACMWVRVSTCRSVCVCVRVFARVAKCRRRKVANHGPYGY